MKKEVKLSSRKHEILCGTIDDYIKDASPITSGGVKEKLEIDVSTATLRHELNTLEEMGYLKQLHTSGGRIPTVLGYKYYVNHLLQNIKVSDDSLSRVKNALEERTRSVGDIISEIAKIISNATNYPTVVVMKGYDKLMIENIVIFQMIDNSAMVIIKTNSGIINNTISTCSSQKDCDDASKLLTEHFAGKTIRYMLENISEIEKQLQESLESFRNIVGNIIEGLRKMSETNLMSIRRDGTAKLLELKEKSSIEDAKQILSLLEDEEKLTSTLDIEDDNKELSFVLDEEDEKYSNCAVVKAPIQVDGTIVGSVGVIGPKRMNYARIASALKVLISEINNDLKIKGGENDSENKKDKSYRRK